MDIADLAGIAEFLGSQGIAASQVSLEIAVTLGTQVYLVTLALADTLVILGSAASQVLAVSLGTAGFLELADSQVYLGGQAILASAGIAGSQASADTLVTLA